MPTTITPRAHGAAAQCANRTRGAECDAPLLNPLAPVLVAHPKPLGLCLTASDELNLNPRAGAPTQHGNASPNRAILCHHQLPPIRSD